MPNRTICIAVAEVINGTKQDFYKSLRGGLKKTVEIANMCASECMKQDDLTKPKPGKIYTYPSINKMAVGWTTQASSIARSVESAYRQDRYLVIHGKRSLRTYRSFPVPVLSSEFKLEHPNESNVLESSVVTFKILGDKWTVRLAGGSNYRDQLAGLRTALKVGDSKVWIDKSGKAIVGFSCNIPVRESSILSGEMTVSSSLDHLIVATTPRTDVPFVINADICKTWQSQANKAYQRLRQDRKSDANRRKIRDAMADIENKKSNRMKSLLHEVSSRIVNRAVRQRIATIRIDFTVKSYISSFPWFLLAKAIKDKAESAGIVAVDATMAVDTPDLSGPHVYFKYSPATKRVKIGMTGKADGSRHGSETDSPEDLVILAVSNHVATKLRAKEKHFHAMFNDHRVKGEWFIAEPVIAWLRAVDWLGNAGNRSQIMQVLDASQDASSGGHLWADRERLSHSTIDSCSHNAVSSEDTTEQLVAALAVSEVSFEY